MTHKTIFEMFKFVFSGGTTLLVQLGILYVFTSILGWWYLTSVIIAHTCAIILNFLLQKFFVSRNFDMSAIRSQFASYLVIAFMYIGINTFSMYVLVSIFILPYLLAQTLIVGVLSVATFFIYRNYIFR